MNKEKEMTAPVVSVDADTEQSSQNLTDNSLTDFDPNFKGFDEMQREILRMMDPSYLKTVSMSELLDNVYQSKPPLVDGLLYRGTYLFVGAPKLGKSFLMTQLAYHISTGTPLWNYPVRKGTVLYLALEDDYRRLQERSYRMFGTAENESLFFSVSAGQLAAASTSSSLIFCGSIQALPLSSLTRSRRCVRSAGTTTATPTIIRSSHG